MNETPQHLSVVKQPDGTYEYTREVAVPEQQPQIVHIHQAPPDKTVQRFAFGSGVGAGTVAAAVYFGPMLVASMTAMAIYLAVGALVISIVVWGLVTIVRTIGGPDGQAAAKAVGKAKGRKGTRS